MHFMFTADFALLIMLYFHWSGKCRFAWWEFLIAVIIISLESESGIDRLRELMVR